MQLAVEYIDKIRNKYWYVKNVVYIILYVVILQIYNVVAYYQIANNFPLGGPYVLATPLDNSIPFISLFAIIYVFIFYPFFIFTFGYYLFIKVENADRFFVSLLIIYFVAYIFYVFFPVKMIRPETLPDDFLSQVMWCYYQLDPPLNCFPSLHAALSSIAAYHLSRDFEKYKYVFWGIAVAVMISTLFVRQHVIVDEIAGFLLAYFAGWFADKKISQTEKTDEYLLIRWLVYILLGILVTVFFLIDYIPPCA